MKEMACGDLLSMSDEFDVIIHGCNCLHTMGAGIALQIRNKYPEAYYADLKTKYGDRDKLGTYSAVRNEVDDIIIVNAYTQFGFGGNREANYDAISDVFELLADARCVDKRVGIPMIGAGLAGGNWDIISNIIETHFKNVNYTLVVYEMEIFNELQYK